jgi:hypothetical protein
LVEKLKQEYDTDLVLMSTRTSSGLILLIVSSVSSLNIGSTYIIGLKSIPESAVGFSGNVFLIPRSLLGPALQSAGVNLQARYAVVEKVISNARPIGLSYPGHLTSPVDIFPEN